MFRLLGVSAMLFAVASTAMAGEHYVEIWNPPEARASMPHHAVAGRRLANGRHATVHAVTMHARRTPAPNAKLAAARTDADAREKAPAHTPDVSEIPRQITPEGNVLRVDSRGAAAVKVIR